MSLAAIFSGRATARPAAGDWSSTERWVRFGNRTVFLLLGGLIGFMALVSISGAVVAPGSVGVEGNYKTVQHLDGGIVSKILVKNGDRVTAGQTLVLLDPTQVKANLAVVEGRVTDFEIQEARLEAEAADAETFALPQGLDGNDPAVAKIYASQMALFTARRTSHLGQIAVLKQRLQQMKEEIAGNQAEAKSALRQSEIAAAELASVMPLLERGFVNQQRVTTLQRENARFEGEIGRLAAEAAKIESGVSETALRIAQASKDNLSEVTDELRKVQSALAEQRETQLGLADKVARSEVKSPHAGRIHALAIHTEGGVIQPGGTILQIVPEGETLVVDAQVQPVSIDKVHEGQRAAVRFPAFNAKTTPRLEGKVIKVSPAQITDQQGKSYFTAQIEVPAAEIARIGKGHELVPGMPAEVYIETEDRSMLSYLIKPLVDAMFGAFRET